MAQRVAQIFNRHFLCQPRRLQLQHTSRLARRARRCRQVRGCGAHAIASAAIADAAWVPRPGCSRRGYRGAARRKPRRGRGCGDGRGRRGSSAARIVLGRRGRRWGRAHFARIVLPRIEPRAQLARTREPHAARSQRNNNGCCRSTALSEETGAAAGPSATVAGPDSGRGRPGRSRFPARASDDSVRP